jgi:predicted RNA-binding Zn-ribbon protein involved in translation (DUF1610 family)
MTEKEWDLVRVKLRIKHSEEIAERKARPMHPLLHFECPACGGGLGDIKKTCPTCGQAIARVNDKGYQERMETEIDNDDMEDAHCKADDILCELLRELGYGKLIDTYEKVPKWYA